MTFKCKSGEATGQAKRAELRYLTQEVRRPGESIGQCYLRALRTLQQIDRGQVRLVAVAGETAK